MLRRLATRAPRASRALSSSPAALPSLPYAYNALEPAIDARIMELHHSKHHAAYVAGFNAASEKLADAQAKGDVAGAVAQQAAINFHGGGFLNHCELWENLTPVKDFQPPSGPLLAAIEKAFGTVEAFQAAFDARCAGIQGSGWGWLVCDAATGEVTIETTANQDRPKNVPLYGLDSWEHAFYLQYGPAKLEYYKAVWTIVNWAKVSERYAAAQAARK